MPVRRKAARILALCLAGLVLAGGSGQPHADEAAAAPEGAMVRLSLTQAQALAQQALRQRQPRTAYELTEGLIAANPENGHAHFLRAHALGQLKDYKTGRKSAARAYRVANTDVQRFEAAKLAAELSFADDSYTVSQLWLRRAVHYAPNEEIRSQYVKAFRNVRRTNPLRFEFQFSVNPSDNVNNGSNSPYNLIEGSPLVGTLSPSARAISGVVAKTDMRGSYRVQQSEGHQTHITGRLLSREIRFNDPVPGISGSDISSLRLQLGANHLWAPGKSGYWSFDVNGGRTWYGGSPYYDFAGLGVRRLQKLTDRLNLSLGTHVEEQFDKVAPITDATVYSVSAGLSYALNTGGELGAQLQFRDIDSDGRNRASQQWSVVATYTLGREIGPAEVSLSLGHSTLDYEQYWVILPVRGGRTDESWFGGVTATFKDYSYMGFVPVVSVNAEKSRSNISRFDVDQTAVSFGIRSEF
ncbi:MAG: surface lipoprotein assembly modifier [Roseovarius sp.]